MSREKQSPLHTPDNDAFLHEDDIASANECTGLMATMPMTDDQAIALSRLGGSHSLRSAEQGLPGLNGITEAPAKKH